MRVEVVRGDHLRDLVGVGTRVLGQEARDGEVACATVAPRDRLVGDPLDEGLEEPEMASLRRERVGVDRQQLLSNEAVRELLHLRLVEAGQRGETAAGEALAEHRCVLEQPALRLGKPVEPGRDERVQRLGAPRGPSGHW